MFAVQETLTMGKSGLPSLAFIPSPRQKLYPLLIVPVAEATDGNDFGWEAFAELTLTPLLNKINEVAIRNARLIFSMRNSNLKRGSYQELTTNARRAQTHWLSYIRGSAKVANDIF